MTQQFWLVQPLFTGVFFTLGIILFFQLLVRTTLQHYNKQRKRIDKLDFSVGRLKLISIVYFSCLAAYFEYSAARVRAYTAFINFRLLLLIFIVIFLGFLSSFIILLCDDLAHLLFYDFSVETLYHSIFMLVTFLTICLAVYLIRRNNTTAAWIIPAAEGIAVIIWVVVHNVNIYGIGRISLAEMWYNMISFLIMETLLFYGLTTLFQENQQLLTVTRQASIDSLTKLKNYNVFNKEYAQAFIKAHQNNLTFTMLEMDIDRFKNINDHYGHLAGNEVLTQVGMILERVTREIDQAECYRTGGEEFNVILPGLSVNAAYQFASRLQKELE